MKPRKHAELIKAWADGAEIQWYDDTRPTEHRWKDAGPEFWWSERFQYRIKQVVKEDIIYYATFDDPTGQQFLDACITPWRDHGVDKLKLTFDGETRKLKAAEVL